MKSSRTHQTLRAIALYEAVKGVLAFFLIIGFIGLLHHDLRHIVLNLIGHFGFNAQAHYSSLALHWADVLNDSNKQALLAMGSCYIALRFAEAYGLWRSRRWAEWLAALSGAIYMPFEIIHMWHAPSWSSILIFSFNGLMVAYLSWQLWLQRRTLI